MSKLGIIIEGQQAEQIPMQQLLQQIAEEENDLECGDRVTHKDFADFRGKIESFKKDKAKVKVLSGWKGRYRPIEPVTIPVEKLVAI